MNYDVIVIGAGHAGLESSLILSKLNYKVCLLTMSEKSVGMMPCSPSIGGPAKGIVTKEIDWLGGMQAEAADACQLQMKMLNTSKGPGVWALRAQIDIVKYHEWFLKKVKEDKNIDLIIDECTGLIIENKIIKGIKINNKKIYSNYVIITAGTYLSSETFKGLNSISEGPSGLKTNKSLSNELKSNNIDLIRLKTGTPARIKKNSIDYSNMTLEPGSNERYFFSKKNKDFLDFKNQLPCYIIHTNEKIHKIIQDNIKESAMYGGAISGTGPRYCPSIEDKIIKFSHKLRHQIFVEPESRSLDTVYLGGFSTSMPTFIQDQMIKSLPGFENCIIDKYAYAIEYDAIDPMQLKLSLESKEISNLFFAGQINGTSGYEEAAAQGLIAGINVNRKAKKEPIFYLKRNEAYIGVMIDDIVTKGITEPYRLLTSRAEHRLSLRNDNVDDRLIEISYNEKLITKDEYNKYKNKPFIDSFIQKTKNITIGMIKELSFDNKKTNQTFYDYLKRPEVKLRNIYKYITQEEISNDILEKIEIRIKFEGYIKKQNEYLNQLNNLEKYSLNFIHDYQIIDNISLEARDKLNKIKPINLDHASRISGINSSDIIAIKLFLERS